jgi:hypothetical protein
MQRSALIVVGVVILASLVGAVGSGAAQSDEDLVTLTLDTVVESSNQQVGGVTLVVSWDDGGQERVTTRSNGQALVDVPEGATVEITLDDDEYTRNEPYRIRVATEKQHTIGVSRQADVDVVVRDEEGPVADARVALVQDGETVVRGRTDGDGRFNSGIIAQGTYRISAVKPGYYETVNEEVIAGSPEKTVRIERGRVDYDILVEDPHFDTAEPVPEATVTIRGVGELTTDDRGSAATLLPVNTDVEFVVSKDGYETTSRTVSVGEGTGTAIFEISRNSSLSLTAVNQRIVVGEVVPVEVTNAYGEPAEGVTVLYDGDSVGRTNAEGRLTVRVESTGEHQIRARRGQTTSETVTVTGISAEAATAATDAEQEQPTESGTTVADDSGLLPGGLTSLLLAAALVVVVLLLVVLVLFLRRRNEPEPDPAFGVAGGDTASGTVSETDTAVDPNAGAGGGAGGGVDTVDTGDGPGAGVGSTGTADADAGPDTGPGTETDTDTSAGPDADAGADADDGSDTGGDTTEGDASDDADAGADDDTETQ